MLSSDPKALAVQTALCARDPFYCGVCAIPDYQCFLYYIHGDLVRRVDVSNASGDDLDALYHACQPAEFGRGRENVFDDSYRKAGKMDLDSFATQFDPRSLGVHEQVSKALLSEQHGMMDMELYKLNVYGNGDFFKAHKDTPRDQDMFGSLVVVLPTSHEGGQLVLRQGRKEWTVDFAGNFANAKGPSVCYVAFYSDVEHEVLPVTSGHRVTLTYNLYRTPGLPTTSPILTPQHLQLERALVDLANDASTLPNGGYLGFGLAHEYVHTGHNILELVLDQLKGSDRALVDVCDSLGLRYTLRLFYRDPCPGWFEGLNLITTIEFDPNPVLDGNLDCTSLDYLELILKERTINETEVIHLVGRDEKFNRQISEEGSFLQQFCKDPPTQVLEVTRMESSVYSESSILTYGNESQIEFIYGTACMLVFVEPAASRKRLEM